MTLVLCQLYEAKITSSDISKNKSTVLQSVNYTNCCPGKSQNNVNINRRQLTLTFTLIMWTIYAPRPLTHTDNMQLRTESLGTRPANQWSSSCDMDICTNYKSMISAKENQSFSIMTKNIWEREGEAERTRGVMWKVTFTCQTSLLPRSSSADVWVYRWIFLCKHWAFALNRQQRYLPLMLSLSEPALTNQTCRPGEWLGKVQAYSFVMSGLYCDCVCVCVCSYYNKPKLCMTLSHFLPFKSCCRCLAADPGSVWLLLLQGGGQIRRDMGLVLNIVLLFNCPGQKYFLYTVLSQYLKF